MVSTKESQFFSNNHKTWSKWLENEKVILAEFLECRANFRDFLFMANFWSSSIFFGSHFRNIFIVSHCFEVSSALFLCSHQGKKNCMCMFRSFSSFSLLLRNAWQSFPKGERSKGLRGHKKRGGHIRPFVFFLQLSFPHLTN